MTRATRTTALDAGEARDLRKLLKTERDAYADLLDLARRQNEALRSHDRTRMEAVGDEWRLRMPPAEAARKVREHFLLELGHQHGIARDELRMSRLARATAGDPGRRLREVLRDWERVASDLMRQNALNDMLARFCLDLVDAEANILCRGMSGKDGCYDATGGERKGACAGVMQHQA